MGGWVAGLIGNKAHSVCSAKLKLELNGALQFCRLKLKNSKIFLSLLSYWWISIKSLLAQRYVDLNKVYFITFNVFFTDIKQWAKIMKKNHHKYFWLIHSWIFSQHFAIFLTSARFLRDSVVNNFTCLCRNRFGRRILEINQIYIMKFNSKTYLYAD